MHFHPYWTFQKVDDPYRTDMCWTMSCLCFSWPFMSIVGKGQEVSSMIKICSQVSHEFIHLNNYGNNSLQSGKHTTFIHQKIVLYHLLTVCVILNSCDVQSLFQSWGSQLLTYHPYSLVLSPCGYSLLAWVKELLQKRHQQGCHSSFNHLNANDYEYISVTDHLFMDDRIVSVLVVIRLWGTEASILCHNFC